MRPTTTIRSALKGVRVSRPDTSVVVNRRSAVSSTVATKTYTRTRLDTTRNNEVPMSAPTTDPVVRKAATGQSTLPCVR
jgi:hypothetical protein